MVSFADSESNQMGEVEVACDRIFTIPKREYNAASSRAIIGLFNRKPRVLVDRYTPEMNERIQDEIAHGNHDLIIASQIYMAAYLDKPRNIPAIFEEVEIGVFEDAVASSTSLPSKFRHRLTLTKMEAYYRNLFRHFSACTVVSNNEKKMLNGMVPGYNPIEVIPNGVDLDFYREFHTKPNRDQLIFTGSFTYRPNYEAMDWFVKSVFPKIRSQVPEVQLIITGDSSNRQLPDTNNVRLTGYVDDIRPLIASSWISLVPIFTGGGTRLKILEAFALRTPVIATSKGAEGLDVRNNVHLLIADSPDEFAEQTLRLLRDEELRELLVSNAYQLIEEEYDWRVIMPNFMSLIDRVTDPDLN